MIGWTRNEAGTNVMGPVLFPVRLPLRVSTHAMAGASPTLELSEEFLARPSPRLPRHDGIRAPAAFGATSLLFHAVILIGLLALAALPSVHNSRLEQTALTPAETPRLVFLMEPARVGPGGGGGGGGNRQREPIPRAQAPGNDSITLPLTKPRAAVSPPRDEDSPPQTVTLDVRPLASGVAFEVGLPDGPAMSGISRGPGSGGGVGDGVGTGIGSGTGPGFGVGSGGGTGGGIYRPGGRVSPPTLLLEVKPIYNNDAMRLKIQGSVLLEAVVQRDGTPRDIRVIRSLDPGGLDRQAVLAVEKWRFNPGRRDGEPVDVIVTIVLDFRIQ